MSRTGITMQDLAFQNNQMAWVQSWWTQSEKLEFHLEADKRTTVVIFFKFAMNCPYGSFVL